MNRVAAASALVAFLIAAPSPSTAAVRTAPSQSCKYSNDGVSQYWYCGVQIGSDVIGQNVSSIYVDFKVGSANTLGSLQACRQSYLGTTEACGTQTAQGFTANTAYDKSIATNGWNGSSSQFDYFYVNVIMADQNTKLFGVGVYSP